MEVYSSKEINVNFGGHNLSKGAVGQGDAVSIEPSGPTFTLRKGNNGGATRNRMFPHVVVKIKLRQTSSENGVLAAILKLDTATDSGVGIMPLVITDELGSMKLMDPEAFIEGDPQVPYGPEEQDITWTIIAPAPTLFVGGH